MPRINWNAIEREEREIEQDDSLSSLEKARLIKELYNSAREEYQEQQRDEMRDEFEGPWR